MINGPIILLAFFKDTLYIHDRVVESSWRSNFSNYSQVEKLDLQRTEYALFPSLIHQVNFAMTIVDCCNIHQAAINYTPGQLCNDHCCNISCIHVLMYPSSKLSYDDSPQEGFSMHMYGGRESLKRDCHGHYFFSSNVKLTQDRCLSLRPHNLQDRRIFNYHYQHLLFFCQRGPICEVLGSRTPTSLTGMVAYI